MPQRSLTPFGYGGSLERRTGGDPFLELHREMNRLFDDVFRGFGMPASGQGQGGMMIPHMDVTETDKEVRICAEMPGVAQDDLDITLDEDMLTIRGEKRSESREERENRHVTERSFGSFHRSLRLPFRVDPDKVQAAFENGVLIVTLPKPEARQQQSRRIAVRGGRQGTGQQEAGQQEAGQPGGSQKGSGRQGGRPQSGTQEEAAQAGPSQAGPSQAGPSGGQGARKRRSGTAQS